MAWKVKLNIKPLQPDWSCLPLSPLMNNKLYMTLHTLALAWHMLVACGVTFKHTHTHTHKIIHNTHSSSGRLGSGGSWGLGGRVETAVALIYLQWLIYPRL